MSKFYELKTNKTYAWTIIRIVILAILIIVFFGTYKFTKNKYGGGTTSEDSSGSWSLSGGDWYYNSENKIKNAWLSDKYFLDENGRMLTNEWIYIRKSDGMYLHSKTITKGELNDIDLTRLSYVAEDGIKLRNKNIYSTPFSFDADGYCSLSIEDIEYGNGADYVIDGLRRYVIIDDRYMQSY